MSEKMNRQFDKVCISLVLLLFAWVGRRYLTGNPFEIFVSGVFSLFVGFFGVYSGAKFMYLAIDQSFKSMKKGDKQ